MPLKAALPEVVCRFAASGDAAEPLAESTPGESANPDPCAVRPPASRGLFVTSGKTGPELYAVARFGRLTMSRETRRP